MLKENRGDTGYANIWAKEKSNKLICTSHPSRRAGNCRSSVTWGNFYTERPLHERGLTRISRASPFNGVVHGLRRMELRTKYAKQSRILLPPLASEAIKGSEVRNRMKLWHDNQPFWMSRYTIALRVHPRRISSTLKTAIARYLNRPLNAATDAHAHRLTSMGTGILPQFLELSTVWGDSLSFLLPFGCSPPVTAARFSSGGSDPYV